MDVNITSEFRHLARVRSLIEERADSVGFDRAAASEFILALDEALTNIIKHAYHSQPGHPIEIHLSMQSDEAYAEITDYGDAFDPDPVVSAAQHYKELPKHRGGLGIPLMERLLDAVEFDIRPGVRNVIRLRKRRKVA
ncbi:MAG: hypothetical protein COS95_01055 [Ignavibacteriales bacterium CG07_land_8_20_14_0_80_59_12]|nr:MAG: hypothetical protein COS95_01055 [Ignavibacteriales bacterium CG07_land_8_20_14_0_80_59_12]